MTESAFKAVSFEEYLCTEENSPVKREYVGGIVYLINNSDGPVGQAESSKAHARIISRILRHVEPILGCRAFSSGIKLRIGGRNSYYYPDVMVACGPEGTDQFSESAPCVLVEVLSKGAAHTDYNTKYGVCTSTPTLQTYLIAE